MEGRADDLKWFGEGFDGFPQRLPEDCVEYMLFIIDAKLTSQRESLARLETVRKEAEQLVNHLLKDYIWQRDSFKLQLETGKAPMCLHGHANYGDSVEDEWLIVYILKELSSRFPELWVQVVDTDGEFLLIEAANALPRWLNPEIAQNRVWIHDNKLRIIPLAATPTSSSNAQTGPVSRSLSLTEAHNVILSTPDILIHSPLIEAEAFYRLRNYPSQIAASLHHTAISIPRKLAYILHDRPSSIAPAVEAFYLRDPIALKTLQKSSPDLAFPPDDLVTVSTRFTRVLYAQLTSQRFSPPSSWSNIFSHAQKGATNDGTKQKEYKRLEIGMKVTSGFEMMVADSKNGDKRVVREIGILLDDLEIDGADTLPTDSEISKWPEVTKEDDESWLDINFEAFQRELDGKSQGQKEPAIPGAFGPVPPSGFGDAKTQADLRKMVERFEDFLNDDNAGAEGAELDDMDFDNDDDDDDDDLESEDEDKDVSFDEKEFAKMMREMMGMPPEEADDETSPATNRKSNSKTGIHRRVEELDTSDEEEDEDEGEEVRKVMERMEAELNEAGALDLDPTPKKIAALKGATGRKGSSGRGSVATRDEESDSDGESDGDGEIDIDFNLARNLLESFKSQAGMAGPGGNMLGMMGMRLPRDEGEEASEIKHGIKE